MEDSPADNKTIINTCQSVLDSVVYNKNVQTEGTTEHAAVIMLPIDSTNTEVVLESITMGHDTAKTSQGNQKQLYLHMDKQ